MDSSVFKGELDTDASQFIAILTVNCSRLYTTDPTISSIVSNPPLA